MKTSFFAILVLIIVLIVISKHACSQFYIKSQTAYSFGVVSVSVHTDDTLSFRAETRESYSYEVVKRTLGKGLDVGASLGYQFSENFSVELAFTYQNSGKTKISYTYLTRESLQPAKSSYSVSSDMLRFSPMLVLKSANKGFEPYLKCGMVLGAINVSMLDESESADRIFMKRSEYSGGMAVGLISAAGSEFKTKKGFVFYTEINFVGMSYAPYGRELREYRENGEDKLLGLTVSQRKVEYNKSDRAEEDVDPNSPKKEMKIIFPFSRIGVNAGLRFNF